LLVVVILLATPGFAVTGRRGDKNDASIPPLGSADSTRIPLGGPADGTITSLNPSDSHTAIISPIIPPLTPIPNVETVLPPFSSTQIDYIKMLIAQQDNKGAAAQDIMASLIKLLDNTGEGAKSRTHLQIDSELTTKLPGEMRKHPPASLSFTPFTQVAIPALQPGLIADQFVTVATSTIHTENGGQVAVEFSISAYDNLAYDWSVFCEAKGPFGLTTTAYLEKPKNNGVNPQKITTGPTTETRGVTYNVGGASTTKYILRCRRDIGDASTESPVKISGYLKQTWVDPGV
jgi:hypothetical protein